MVIIMHYTAWCLVTLSSQSQYSCSDSVMCTFTMPICQASGIICCMFVVSYSQPKFSLVALEEEALLNG